MSFRRFRKAVTFLAFAGAALSGFAQPIIDAHPRSQEAEAGSDAMFQVFASGTAPLSFQWRKNTSPLSNQTNSTLLLTNVQPGDAGNYSIVITNFSGSVTSQVATLTVGLPQFLLPLTNRWRFNASGADPGAGWNQTNYNDSSWPQGNALFYSTGASVPAPLNTLLALTNGAGQSVVTYYFRTHFACTGSTAGLVLVATNYVEAGAVFYLNGVELDRFRLPNGTISASTLGFVGPEAQGNVMMFRADALRPGDNVLAVEVHRDSATNLPDSHVVFGLSLKATPIHPALPDLIIWGPKVAAHFEWRTFATNDCEVNEGCASAGSRLLLRFATETRNAGTADLVLGNPANNPLFVFDPCHNHYHFNGYVDMRLVDTNGTIVAVGKKIGFELSDGERWDTTYGNPVDHFEQDDQGIQSGWADLYDYLLPCQYVDITGVPPGSYTLELEVDPDHKLPELNETNNLTRVPIVVPVNAGICSGPPANDAFSNALAIPYRVGSALANSDCATREAGEPMIIGNGGGRSVWFRWTAPYTGTLTVDTEGSDFDTILGFYSGSTLTNLTAIAGDDDSGAGRTSRIVASVSTGVQYSIAIDGYFFPNFGRAYSGNVVLNLNASGNDYFTNAQAIGGVTGTIAGTTAYATKESGEPNHAGNSGGHSIWYSWIAPTNGWVMFDTTGSRFDTLLAIYTGTLPSLTAIASNAGTNGFSRVAFNAVAGATYQIAVDGRDGGSGLIVLNWRPALRLLAPAVAGNSFRFTLSGLVGDHCVVETSDDLSQWTPALHMTNLSGSDLITIPLGANRKFYRVRTE